MSLRDDYTRFGHDPKSLGCNPNYLQELASDAAKEVYTHSAGDGQGFDEVRELARILKEYQLKDLDTFLTYRPGFPYDALGEALRSGSAKEIHVISELALEMRLFRAELESVPTSPTKEKLEEIGTVLFSFAKEIRVHQEMCRPGPRRMVA